MNAKKTETAAPAQAIARLAPSRLPIVGSIAKEFDVTPDQWRVLVDQIFPNAKSIEAIGMALSYCRARKLDIYKRPVHIVPMYSTVLKKTVETVWPGIAEIRTTAHRTGNYGGIDPIRFGEMIEMEFEDYQDKWEHGQMVGQEKITATVTFPEYAEATVYRMVEGQRMPFTATVYWEEAYATVGKTSIPNTMWQKRPRGQLAKCVEAAAIRMAFPEETGNTYAAEEMEGRVIEGAVNEAAAVAEIPGPSTRPTPPKPPAKAETVEDQTGDASNGDAKIIAEAASEGVPLTDGDKTLIVGVTSIDDKPEAEPEPGSDEWFVKLEWWLGQAGDEDAIEEVFTDLDVESVLADTSEAAMARADALKIHHIARVKGQGSLQL